MNSVTLQEPKQSCHEPTTTCLLARSRLEHSSRLEHLDLAQAPTNVHDWVECTSATHPVPGSNLQLGILFRHCMAKARCVVRCASRCIAACNCDWMPFVTASATG